MPEFPRLRLASEDPPELIVLMLIGADGSVEPREIVDPETGEPRELPDSELEPSDRARRRGFQIALDAVSAPPGALTPGEYPRPTVADSHRLIDLLLRAAVSKICPDDHDTLGGVEVALEAVLASEERPASEVVAERFAAARR